MRTTRTENKGLFSWISFILICGFLFAYLDYSIIYLTRFAKPEWKDWMHAHEKQYSLIVRPLEYIICTPALAIKEHFYLGLVSTQMTVEEQNSIIHFPYSGNPLLPDGANFWQIHNRESGWQKVSFAAWYLIWLPKCIVWFLVARKAISYANARHFQQAGNGRQTFPRRDSGVRSVGGYIAEIGNDLSHKREHGRSG